MKEKFYNDEIDIREVIFNLWDNKIKIIVITIIFLILGFLYFYSFEKKFIALTNIKPISVLESEKYQLFNILAKETLGEQTLSKESLDKKTLNLDKESSVKENILKLDQEILLNFFINKIQGENFIEKAIIKFELVNKDEFKNEENYKDAIKRTAISIIDQMIIPASINNKKNKSKNATFWKFNYEVSDKKTWSNFLEYLEKQANQEIKQDLIVNFNKQIEILNISEKFRLEDIDLNINNEIDNYKMLISNKVEFLKEQAEIARALDIAKNTLNLESFQTDSGIVTTSIRTENKNSYYLRGYEMIEKEISLINSRKNEKLFIPNIVKLEKDKRSILNNKKIERLRFLFSKIPVNDKNNFMAAKIDYVATVYKSNQSLVRIMSISLIIGLLVSIIFILLNNVISSRK